MRSLIPLSARVLLFSICLELLVCAHARGESVNPGSIASTGKPVAAATELKSGDILQVEWGGRWWAGSVVSLESNGCVKIHYIGWAASWDEIVPRSRLQIDPEAAEKTRTTMSAAKRSWGPEQATGAPDTPVAGDCPTAWASLRPDNGVEWLKVGFEKSVSVAEVRIRESFNPGAVSKVVAVLKDDEEHRLWEGQDPTSEAPADFVAPVTEDVVTRVVKIYLDTKRKSGWNEIDAVELVAKDGSRQWASIAAASSTYAEQGTSCAAYQPRSIPSDPFGELLQKRVRLHLEGGETLEGMLTANRGNFIEIKRSNEQAALIVNKQKIVYLETIEKREASVMGWLERLVSSILQKIGMGPALR
ncbi:MAG: hypothetical protein HY360_26785 [Verrucomicrobia bacterium]|nr:hypothetical protein [Verrucomicrobiota bacterium]